MSMEQVTLRSSDNEEFVVNSKVAMLSTTLKNLIDDYCAGTVVPVPNVAGNILSKVIDYCKKHSEAADEESLKDWDAKFVNVDQATLFDLILAANYLEIKGLLNVTCQCVADMIKGVHVGYTSTFKDYFRGRTLLEYYDVPDYDTNSPYYPTYPLDKNRPLTRVYFVPDENKKIFKSIVKMIVNLHKNHCCIQSLAIENLVMEDATVKLWNAKFEKLTDEGRANDFKNLDKIISPLFSEYKAELGLDFPLDMTDFVKKLSGFTKKDDDESILYHIAILSSGKRLSLFCGLHEKRWSLNKADRGLYENTLFLPKKGIWRMGLGSQILSSFRVSLSSQLFKLSSKLHNLSF